MTDSERTPRTTDIEAVREALKIGAISYDGDSWYAAAGDGGAGLGYDHCEAAINEGFAALDRLAEAAALPERAEPTTAHPENLPWSVAWGRSDPEGLFCEGIKDSNGDWVARFDDDYGTNQGANAEAIVQSVNRALPERAGLDALLKRHERLIDYGYEESECRCGKWNDHGTEEGESYEDHLLAALTAPTTEDTTDDR